MQNFTNKESAILELVKNAYDACANNVLISFEADTLTSCDDKMGMDKETIHFNMYHRATCFTGIVPIPLLDTLLVFYTVCQFLLFCRKLT